MSYFEEIEVLGADSGSIDAFARWRISQPFTVFDSKQIFDDITIPSSQENQPLFYDNQQVIGSGTATLFNVNRASTTLSVSNLTAGKRIRQTKGRFNYQSGKSNLIIMTGVFGTGGSGITKQMGYFDDENGLYFEQLNGDLYVAILSNATGAPVATRVLQSNWNLDTLDGTGPSQKTLDITNAGIWFFDFEWLGVGRVRFGVFIDGLPIYIHEFLHANIISSVYMSTPNLPLRVAIENDGTGGIDSIETICSTVISEGGQDDTGFIRYSSRGNVALNTGPAGPIWASQGFRLKPEYLGTTIKAVFVTLISSVNDDFEWTLQLNPTINGVFTYTPYPNSAVEVAVGGVTNTLASLGTEVGGGYGKSASTLNTLVLPTALAIGSDIAGVRDELVLCLRPLTNNAILYSSLSWRELV